MAKTVKNLLSEETIDQELNDILESLNQDVANPEAEMDAEVTNAEALQGHENMTDLKTPEGETGGNDTSTITNDDVVSTEPSEDLEAPDKTLIESDEDKESKEDSAKEETPEVDPKEVAPQAAQSEDVKPVIVEEDDKDDDDDDDDKESDDKDDNKESDNDDDKDDDKKTVTEDEETIDDSIINAVADISQNIEGASDDSTTPEEVIESEAEAALAQAEQDNVEAIEKAADEATLEVVDEANIEKDVTPPITPDGEVIDDIVEIEPEYMSDSSFEESMANIFKVLKETSEENIAIIADEPTEDRESTEETPEVKEDDVAPTAAQSEDVKPVVVEEIQDNEGTDVVPDIPEATDTTADATTNAEVTVDNGDIASDADTDMVTPDSNKDQTGIDATPVVPQNNSIEVTDTPVIAADKEAEVIDGISKDTADNSEDAKAPDSNEGNDPVIPQPETNIVAESDDCDECEPEAATVETPEVTNDDVYCDSNSKSASDLKTPEAVDAIVEESFVPYTSIKEAFMLQEDYFERESRVKVSTDQKAKKLTEQVALVIAKESRDPLYEELIRTAANAKSIYSRLVESYSEIASQRASKIIEKKKSK